MEKLEKIIMEEVDARIEMINDEEYIFPKRLNKVDWIGIAIISVVCLAVIIFQSLRLSS